MSAFNSGLDWVPQNDPGLRFEPRKVRGASTSLGTYEVFQDGASFNAWFTSEDSGVLVFLGRSETANGARWRCERHARQWRERETGRRV